MNELNRYLKVQGIDEIEDDEEFCRAEHEAVYNYCAEKNFEMSDDDIQTIYARGLEDAFDFWKNSMD